MSETPGVYPPKWHPDPFGRFEYRWYDGSNWTEKVSNQGQETTDPPVSYGVPPVPGLAQPQRQTVVVRRERMNGEAIASLVFAILWVGGFGSVMAILIGWTALRDIEKRPQPGAGIAQAGIWLGVAGLIGAVIVWYPLFT